MSHSATFSLSSFTTFGELLRFLRRRARLQQRDLAIAVGYSEGQICRLEQNQRLPDLPTLAARFVPALDLEDAPELAARLLELASAARNTEPGKGAEQPDVPRAPAQSATRLGNLPTPLTPLINRTREIAAISDCLARADVHLITLVGPPGIGKTRLGLHVAEAGQARFRDGVWFIALAPIRDPAQVLPAIAHALGIKKTSEPTIDVLRTVLCDRQALLVLDYFEQVADAAPQVAELLRAAPKSKALVTSRAALHLSGEHLFVVPPLDRPDPRRLPPLALLAAMPAVELFITRLQAIRPDFELTQEHAAAIAEICTCLDGLPLAIELAAARGRMFGPQALLDRLRDASGPQALRFLVDGPRDLLVHQQTLRSTIDWSYDLLHKHERTLLQSLSVFVGGWTLEAAEAVCEHKETRSQGDKGIINMSISDSPSLLVSVSVLDGLATLADQSLLRQEEGPDGALRFTMLETIREYGYAKLEASGQATPARRQHAHYYLRLAQTAERELSGVQQMRWFAQLEAEHSNLWAALEWFASHEIANGLRLACSLRQFWHVRGYLSEARAWIEAALAGCDDCGVTDLERANALYVAGFLAFHQGDLARTEMLSDASLAMFRELGDQFGIALLLTDLGSVAHSCGDANRAAQLYGEALALSWKIGDKRRAAFCLEGLAGAATNQPLRAAQLFGAAAALRDTIGAPLPPSEQASYDRSLAATKLVDPSAWAAAWEIGRAMALEQAIEYALDSY